MPNRRSKIIKFFSALKFICGAMFVPTEILGKFSIGNSYSKPIGNPTVTVGFNIGQTVKLTPASGEKFV